MEKAVIFDLDGTIIHSLPDIAENINIMLKEFGYPQLSDKEIMKNIGNGARRLVKDCINVQISESELDERLAFYNEIYTASPSAKTRVFDGVAELLFALKEKGYKLCILTNKPQETTDTVVREHLQKFNFDMVVGSGNGVKCKPDKTATLNILKELGVAPENAFFVGDGETDVLTAVNSNVKGIAVLWGYRDKEQLESAGAKVFAQTPSQVLNFILSN